MKGDHVMPRQLWNEGRVVGYSAYEMYVRHALETDPNHEPVSERQWLASMIAMGSSMLLKIDPDDEIYDNLHYRDIQFPSDSRLCAANTILASLFIGEGISSDDSPWCTKVTSYGPLINNTAESSPNGTVEPDGDIPPSSIKDNSADEATDIEVIVDPYTKLYNCSDSVVVESDMTDIEGSGWYWDSIHDTLKLNNLYHESDYVTDADAQLQNLQSIYNDLINIYGGSSIIVNIFVMNMVGRFNMLLLCSISDISSYVDWYESDIQSGWAVSNTTKINNISYSNVHMTAPFNTSIDVNVQSDDILVIHHYDEKNLPHYLTNKLAEYVKIIDGIVIQPGTWVTNPNTPPQKDFTPTLSEYPRLRIAFSERVTSPFFLLLTGFTNRAVVTGVTSFSSAVNTDAPQDGDFLGPSAFPWTNKIIFSVPPSYITYFMNDNYSRKLPSNAESVKVNAAPIIDMKATDPGVYYNRYATASRIPMNVTSCSSNSISALTIYQDDNTLPPALYGTKLDRTGTNYLNPLDCVAPGTVKLFHDVSENNKLLAKGAEKRYKNYSLLRKSEDYTIHQLDESGNTIPVADVELDSDTATYATIKAGNKQILSLSMIDENNEKYPLSGTSGAVDIELRHTLTSNYISNYEGSFSWNTLIQMLHSNKKGKIKMAIKSVDPNNYIAVDITPALYNSEKISASFKFGGNTKDVLLKIPKPGDTWDNLSSDYAGYFRMVIKLNTTEVGTTSKFEINCFALLKNPITILPTENKPYRFDTGFYWRGDFGDGIYPIFGTTPPGINSNAGTPVTFRGICEGINDDLIKTFKADSIGFDWGLDLRFTTAQYAGDNNDAITLIDRSYRYTDDSSGIDTISGRDVEDSITSYTYKSANRTNLFPDKSDRTLTKDEYNALSDNSAVVRSCFGVYAI